MLIGKRENETSAHYDNLEVFLFDRSIGERRFTFTMLTGGGKRIIVVLEIRPHHIKGNLERHSIAYTYHTFHVVGMSNGIHRVACTCGESLDRSTRSAARKAGKVHEEKHLEDA